MVPGLRSPLAATLLLASSLGLAGCQSAEEQKQAYLASGDAFVAKGQQAQAIVEYRNAVRLDNKFGEARVKLSAALEAVGDIPGAAAESLRAADLLPGDRDVQLKAGNFLLMMGRFEDARTKATQILQGEPKDVEAMVLLATSTAAMRDPDGAIRQVEEALRIRPDDGEIHVALASFYVDKGNRTEAEAAYKRALTLAPKAVAPRTAFANFLWAVGRSSEAEAELRQALLVEPNNLTANRMLGMLYLATGRRNEAEAPLKAFAESSPAPSDRLLLADYYIYAQRNPEALAVLNELAKVEGTATEAELRIATVEYSEGKRDAGYARLDRVLKQAPRHAPSLSTRAQWKAGDNKLDEALADAQAAIEADPAFPVAHYTLGTVHERRRDPTAAMSSFNEALKLNPRMLSAQLELSRLNLRSGTFDAALQYAQDARRTMPASGMALVSVARAKVGRGDIKGAEADLVMLKKAAPDQPDVMTLEGLLQASRGQIEPAKATLQKVLATSPKHTQASAMLVDLQLRSGDLTAAATTANAQLALQPESPEVLRAAARSHLASGDKVKAEAALRKAVTIDPRYFEGYTLLAELYASQGSLDAARQEFQRIVDQDSTHVPARTMVGLLLEAQNKRAEAKRWYEQTMATVPDNAPVVANNLAYIYAVDNEKLDVALDLAKSAKRQLPDNAGVSDTLGWLYLKREFNALAVEALEEAVKQEPKYALAHYHLGQAYIKTGNRVRARTAFTTALALDPQAPEAAEARKALASL